MIKVTPYLSLDESELAFSFIRSPGPGGQNVNKVASAAQLRFDAASSKAINPAMFARLAKLAGNKMNKDGVIVITAHQFRTQVLNKEDATNRLVKLLAAAAYAPRKRVATKPSRGAKERRLEGKRHSSLKKQNRGKVNLSD